MYSIPVSIKAAKAVTIRGNTYAKNDPLSAAQIAAIPKLSALLSKGVLYSTPDVQGRNMTAAGAPRRGKRRPAPTHVNPKLRKYLAAGNALGVTASAAARVVTITITNGDAPYAITWGDTTSSSNVKANVVSHTYTAAGTYSIQVTGSNSATVTVSSGALA